MNKSFKERIKVEPKNTKKDTLSYPFGLEDMLLEAEFKKLDLDDNKKEKEIEEK